MNCFYIETKHGAWETHFRTGCGQDVAVSYSEDDSPFAHATPIKTFGPYCRFCGKTIKE